MLGMEVIKMYSWGPNTTDWKTPSGYKYDSARKPYLDKLAAAASKAGPRTYSIGTEPDWDLVNPFGKTISSDSKNPVIVAVDVTGSMSEWPGEIFDRLPLLYQTLSQYRDDVEICFAAIGDAYSDRYPLQVNDFGKGLDLEKKLKALYPEGAGGGQVSESYELFAYDILNHCKTKNAISPFLIIYGDEKFYKKVDEQQVKHLIGDKLEGKLDSDKVWQGLMQRFNLFYLQKPYGSGYDSDVTKEVRDYWAKTIGRERVIALPEKERAVDVAIGLIAKSWGEYGDFTKNLAARQDEDAQLTVHNTLAVIDINRSGMSMLPAKISTKRTKPLV
jgi:hypothetical protein